MTVAAPVIVPVNLGCCPDEPRCLLCPPPPRPPGPDLVEALVHHYRTERAGPGALVRVGFYGGPPPDDRMLQAIGDLPFVARVRPDLLTRAALARLVDAGAVGIELDILTLKDTALRASGRTYRSALILEQLEGIRKAAIGVGVVLAPGLPGTDHADSVRDAESLHPLIDFARLHPVLVLRDSGLRLAHMDGMYEAMTLGQAVTTCRAMLDILEPAGVRVIRVGQNPGPDGLGRAVAGPCHPSLRQLVEARRVIETLHQLVPAAGSFSRIRIRCHPSDETQTRGPRNQHIRELRAAHGLAEVCVVPDLGLVRGALRVEPLEGP